jgi:sugar/nucleoside kinase (ribokinase family)
MAARFDACVVGHVARDINRIGDTEYESSPGGAAYYSTMVYRRLGLRAAVVTKVAGRDRSLLRELEDAGVEVFNLPSAATTTFRNVYPSAADPDNRIQRVDAQAGPIAVDAMPDLRARIWQIGPLTGDDVELAMISHCAGLGGLVALDVQGLTRVVRGGEVRASAPAERMDDLACLDVLKADDAEILTYTGAEAVGTGVAAVRAAGVREVLVTRASAGAVIYGPGPAIAIDAAPPLGLVDATGCGDTFLAAYMTRRLTSDDLRDCGEFAAAAAAINIETSGAFRGTAADVAERRTALQRRPR